MYINKQKTLMKKLKLFTLGLLGASTLFMTSCADDDEDPAVGPTLTVTEENSAAGVVDGKVNTSADSLYFRWDSRAGDAKLQKFTVERDGVSQSGVLTEEGNDLDDNIKSSVNDSYQDGIKLPALEGVYTFKVTDRDGESAMVDIEVMVGTPMAIEVTGAFFHIAGTSQGSYDLIADATVAAAASDDDKDMSNTDAAGDPFTGSWEAKNATMFVKASGFDYATATVEGAAAAYANGTANSSVANPATGDIYIAMLRGTSTYVVIKITDVDPTDNTCNCGNLGKITFDYKKA